MHLYLANRDVLLTPFHNMALTCPATTDAQLRALIEAFRGRDSGVGRLIRIGQLEGITL